MYRADQDRVLAELAQRVLGSFNHDPEQIERALLDTIYDERRRLEALAPNRHTARGLRAYDRLQQEARHAGPFQHKQMLAGLIRMFGDDIAGHFTPAVYSLATRLAPPSLSVLLNTLSPMKVLEGLPSGFSDFQEQLRIEGEVDAVNALGKRGTTIVVPTHASHLDGLAVAFALYRMGRPPHLFAAESTLFETRVVGRLLSNLGAYKVDGARKSRLYQRVLESYTGYTLEQGYNHLLFPAGRRSPSGAVESRLELGLLGTGLDAYYRNLVAGKESPDIFIIPCTVNYELVLEAETLIESYLREEGKSRYVLDDFVRPQRVVEFAKKLFSLDSRIHVVFGGALDVFGNPVDIDGNSLDTNGRTIDRKRYLFRGGAPVQDHQRNSEFTRQLSEAILRDYRKNTVIKTTHLLCSVVFDWLEQTAPSLDLYHLLRFGGPKESFPLVHLYKRIQARQAQLQTLHNRRLLRLDSTVTQDPVDVLNQAVLRLNSYHRPPVVLRKGDQLYHCDRNLLLYYRNRLSSLGCFQDLDAP